jgi:tight adherence protein C
MNMDLLFSPATVSFLVVLVVLAVGLALKPNSGKQAVKSRVAEYLQRSELEDSDGALRALQGSFFTRVIGPMLRRFLQALGKLAPAHTLDDINQLLTVAGRPGNLTATDFIGMCVLVSALLALAGFIYAQKVMADSPMFLLIGPLLGAAMGFMLPRYWLISTGRRRKDLIQRTLPDALDMLTVCVEAGLAFESALLRVSERWPGPLSEEFARVVTEVRLGVARSQALRRMSTRCDSPDVGSFVAVLVQADSMGTSIAQVIHSQADQIRVLRRQRAEEKANKAPIKVLIPMVLFIFPALFVVILGPGVPRILEGLSSAGG